MRTDKIDSLADSLFPQSVETVGQHAWRLRRQWLLTKAPFSPPSADWRSLRLSRGWRLWRHPDCKITVVDRGRARAILLGVAASSGACPERTLEDALVDEDSDRCRDRLIDALNRFSGTYTLLWITEASAEAFTDPAAMAAVYFRAGAAASTPALLTDNASGGSAAVSCVTRTNDWLPGSSTPFPDVRALFANHALDVESGEMRRFWPLHPSAPIGFDDGVDRAAELISATITRILDSWPSILSITGGLDSRVNLAAASRSVLPVETFTLLTSVLSKAERKTIDDLVRITKVDHQYVPYRRPSATLITLYDEMTLGMAVGTRRDVIASCLSLATDPDLVHINGSLGALAKGFYWGSGTPKDKSTRCALRDFVNPASAVREGLADWAASTPSCLSPAEFRNLLYLEQRGGRWMGVAETASQLFYDSFSPFCSREFFSIVCGLPVRAQTDGAFLKALVQRLCPGLAFLPYHSGTRRWRRLVPKRVKHVLRRATEANEHV